MNNVQHSMRVIDATMARGGQQNMTAVSEDVALYDVYVESAPATNQTQESQAIDDTDVLLLDLPALPNDTSNDGALYAAFASGAPDWRGAVLYASDDGGEAGGNNYNAVLSTASRATMGTVLNQIPDHQGNIWDRTSIIRVALRHGTLSSTTELAVLNGANGCVIGREVLQFTTAALVDTNVYELSNLLRGRLGTEHETAIHAIGDDFVLLGSGVERDAIDLGRLGIERHYKGVTIGQPLADADEQVFTYAGVKFRPYSPVDIRGSRNGSNDLTITWKRRTRLNGQWRDLVDVPLSEETEAYEIDVMDGATVMRTLTATSQTVNYSATEQIADFNITKEQLEVRIFQISAMVGRGVASEAII